MEYKEFDDSFLFSSNPEQQKEEMSFLLKKTKNQDGIYRPTLEESADPKIGYKSKIRFLKNLPRNGKQGPNSIDVHYHYVDKGPFDSYPDLIGYYNCERNYKDKCELCGMYYKLHKSKNQADVDRAENIKRGTKYYSYVMILEDVQHPELVGKIMVFPYTYQIKTMINAEWTGEAPLNNGVSCNVFNFNDGKDFQLIIKENKTPKGTFPSYLSSGFLERSPIKIWNENKQVFIPADLDSDGNITEERWQKKIRETMLARDEKVNLEDHLATKEWTDEDREKVGKIISILKDGDIELAESSINEVRNTAPSTSTQTMQSRTTGSGNRPQPKQQESNIEDMDEFFKNFPNK